jgi:hypothetical protein
MSLKDFSTIATASAGQEDSDLTKASVGGKAKRSRTHPKWHHLASRLRHPRHSHSDRWRNRLKLAGPVMVVLQRFGDRREGLEHLRQLHYFQASSECAVRRYH